MLSKYAQKVSAQQEKDWFTPQSAATLAQFFERSARGDQTINRTPLYKDQDPMEVVKEGVRMVSESPTAHASLKEYEEERLKIVGPQSVMLPASERVEGLELYFNPREEVELSPEHHELGEQAKQIVADKLGGDQTLRNRPKTHEKVVEQLRKDGKLSTNSGAPDFTTRSLVVDSALADAKSGKWKEYPGIGGGRGSRNSQRTIIMTPFSSNINGQRFAMTVVDRLKLADFSKAYVGFEAAEQAISNSISLPGNIRAGDYSKMDTTLREGHARQMYDVVKMGFQQQYWDEIGESIKHTTNMDLLVTRDEYISMENHGYFSGNEGTNPGETVFSEVLMEFEALLEQQERHKDDQELGDDLVTKGLSGEINAESFVNVSAIVNTDSNLDKQLVSESVTKYLQRLFDKTYKVDGIVVGVYPGTSALNAMLYPEKFHDPDKWSKEMEIMRGIMILENCHRHPMFHRLIEYAAKGDKFDLGRAIPGFFDDTIVNLYKEAKTMGVAPSYTQEHVDRGIYDFEVVKYLMQS